jgi:PAS domain S-box-containing protein
VSSEVNFHQFDIRLLDISPVGMIIINLNGDITYANKKAEEILELSASLVTERAYNSMEWIATDFEGNPISNTDRAFSLVLEKKVTISEIEYAIETPSGKTTYLSINASPIFDANDAIEGVFASIEDITNRGLKEKELIKAKELAEHNENRYKALVKNLETGVVIHAQDTSIISCNTRSQELLGLTEDQMRGKDAIDPYCKFIYEDGSDIPLEDYPVMRVLSTKTDFQNQIAGVSLPDKNIIWLLVNGLPVLNEKDEIKEIIISFIDITERKFAEKALIAAKEKAEESQTRLSLATGSANLGIWEWDIEKQVMLWDDRTYELFGYDKETSKSTEEIWAKSLHPDDEAYVLESIDNAIKGRKAYDATFRVIHPNGSIFYINGNGLVVRNSNGDPIRMIGINRDISESREQEIELEQAKETAERSEQRLILANKISQLGVYDWDIKNETLIWDERTFELYGVESDNEFSSYEIWSNGLHPDDKDRVEKEVQYALEGHRDVYSSFRIQQPNGRILHVRGNGLVLRDENNAPIRMIGLNQDVTAEVLREAELNQSKIDTEKREFELTESQKIAKIGSWYLNLATNDVIWTEELYRMYGFDPTQPVPNFSEFENLYTPDSWNTLATHVQQTIETGEPFELELELVRKDGSIGWLLAKGVPVFDEKKQIIGLRGIAQDIHERKQLEDQLISAKNEAERVIEQLNESQKIAKIGSWHLDVLTNDVTWSQELYDMYGFDSSIPPPPYTEHMKLFTPESWDMLSKNLAKTAEEGIPFELELQTIRLDRSNGWMWVKSEAIKNENDKIIVLRGVAQDITERKEYEETIRKSLVEKEMILAEVHHRVKNNLALISSMLYLQEKEYKNNDFSELVRDSQSRIQSIANVHELIYQNENESFIEVNVDKYIERIHDQLKRIYVHDPDRIEFTINLDPIELVIEEAIPIALIINEVLTNIFKHAFEDDQNGEIKIDLIQKNRSIHLEICDNGVDLPKDFNPETSSSLGYTLIKQFTAQLEGKFEFNSGESGGTCFHLTFDKTEV